MKVTNIYGLFDPRSSDIVMYVGKGLEKRAQHHWKRFLAKGVAVNALLRRWFERLRADGVEPACRFLEENVEDWQKAERDLISTWRVMNPALCNVADGGNDFPLESTRLGGQIGGRINGGAHEMSAEAKERQRNGSRIGGPIGGRRTHELHPEWGAELGRKYGSIGGSATNATTNGRAGNGGRIGGIIGGRRCHELHPGHAKKIGRIGGSRGGSKGGPIGMHVRWHVKRDRFNPACQLCCSELS